MISRVWRLEEPEYEQKKLFDYKTTQYEIL